MSVYWISHVHVWERLLQKIDFCLTLFMNMNWLLFSLSDVFFFSEFQSRILSLNSLIYHPSPWKRVPFGRIINQASSLDPLTAKFKEAFSIILLLKCRIKLKNILLHFKLFSRLSLKAVDSSGLLSVTIDRILSVKNACIWISMDFT